MKAILYQHTSFSSKLRANSYENNSFSGFSPHLTPEAESEIHKKELYNCLREKLFNQE
jgi:hypothetical protein